MEKTRMLLFVLLLSRSLVCVSEDFADGVKAFNQGEYARALEYFDSAQAGGNDTNALRYNIAVSHYRLQHWAEANTLFLELYAENPRHELIAYNLAVTEKKLGDLQRAQDLFLEVALTSATPEHAALANRQYRLLAKQDTTGETASDGGRWLAGVDVSYGVDENVIDPADLSGSNIDDSFTESLLTARWYSGADSSQSWVVDGFAYVSRYSQVDEYDIDMADVGFKKYSATAYGSWYVGARVDSSQLGGEGYLQSVSLNLGTAGRLNAGVAWNLQYRNRQHSSLSDEYDPLVGSNQQVSLDFGGRMGSQARWKTDYRFEIDDRDDADLGEVFTSYSAQRHTLGASWALTSGDLRTAVRADYRYSDYLDDNLLADGRAVGRQDNRMKLTLGTSWFFNPNWSLKAEYSYTDNDSNIDTYDYDRQLLMLGIGWQW